MIKEDCLKCETPLVPMVPPKELGEFKDEFFECPHCHAHYRIPFKGEIIKIGAEQSAPILFVFLFYFSSPVILIKLFQFCANNCFAGFSTCST